MVMSLRERLEAEKAKKEAEARAKALPTAAVAASTPAPLAEVMTKAITPSSATAPAQAPPPLPQKPLGKLAGLLRKSTTPAPVSPAPKPVHEGAIVGAKVTALQQPKTLTGGVIDPARLHAKPPQAAPPPVADLSDENLATFRAQLKYLEENIEQKELIGQVVRNIMQMWRKNPQFSSSISNADEDIIARGFMRAFNVAARRKTEDQGRKKEKRAGIAELDELMKGAGFDVKADPLGKMFGG